MQTSSRDLPAPNFFFVEKQDTIRNANNVDNDGNNDDGDDT